MQDNLRMPQSMSNAQLAAISVVSGASAGILGSLISSSPVAYLPATALASLPILLRMLRRKGDPSGKGSYIFKVRPKHDPKISKPNITTLETRDDRPAAHYVSALRASIDELKSVYGELPVWTTYSSVLLARSWMTGNTVSLHRLTLYGEKSYVGLLLDRLSRILPGLSIKEAEPSGPGQAQPRGADPMPGELTPTQRWGDLISSMLGGGGFLALALGLLLTFSRKATPSDRGAGRDRALAEAEKALATLGYPQKLLDERVEDDGWSFHFQDFEVLTNSDGQVISMTARGDADD